MVLKTQGNAALAQDHSEEAVDASPLSEEEIQQLILEHREHGQKTAWKLLGQWRISLTRDEVTSIVGIALCEAAHRFRPEYNTAFRTFFFYHLRGVLLKEVAAAINQRRIYRAIPSGEGTSRASYDMYYLDQLPSRLWDRETPEKRLQVKELGDLCREACSYLDDLEQEVVTRHVFLEESLTNVANDLGYCRCHLSRVKSKALKTLEKILSPIVAHGKEVQERGADPNRPAPSLNTPRVNYKGGRGRRKSRTSDTQHVEPQLKKAV